MSQHVDQLDLSQLAVDRSESARPMVRMKRSWLTRVLLPTSILIGFASLFAWAARDSFLPAQSVTITPVVVSRAEFKKEGTPLFQAAGWVEPRPSPVVASSLAPGVIDKMLVIEGQIVEQGEPVALLIDADARLSLAQTKARHSMQLAEVRRAEATLAAANTNLENPVNLQAALADAEAMLAETKRELDNLPYALSSAKTRQQLAADSLRRKEAAGNAITGSALREAQAELATTTHSTQALAARLPTLKMQFHSLEKKRKALAEKLHLLTDEKQSVAEAKANLSVMQSLAAQAQLAVKIAELKLVRMTVRAPIAGRVLSVMAQPGQRLSGMNPHSEQGSSAVASLYDPSMLQIRVDVRLEDLPHVQIGQSALIETAALASELHGEVLSVTTLADIQKNTLQVKVAIHEPPAVIKPEMLGKVTFLALSSPVVEGDQLESPLKIFVPQSLVNTQEHGTTVWVADLTGRTAKQKTVSLGPTAIDNSLVEVTQGLQPTDKLIVAGRESVSDGSRIRVTGEDRSLREGNKSQPVAQTAQTLNPGN